MPSKSDKDRLRGEVGELIVAYELMKQGWNVMKNLGGQGYDLLAISNDNKVSRAIEVKTTDPALKEGKTRKQLTVLLTKSELGGADFLIFYVHGHNTFFVIPKHRFPESGSITLFIGKDGKITQGTAYEEFRDNWQLLD